MPRAPKKCGHDTCEQRVRGRAYCTAHTPVNWPATTRDSSQHKAWRKQILSRAKGSCQINGPRCTHRATEADHIIPIAEGGAPYELDNGQAACVPCHRAKTQQEALRGRQRAAGGSPPPAPTR